MTKSSPSISGLPDSQPRSFAHGAGFPLLKSLRKLEWLAIAIILAADLCHRYIASHVVGPKFWGSLVLFIPALGLLAFVQSRDLSGRRPAERMFWFVMQIVMVVIASIFGT